MNTTKAAITQALHDKLATLGLSRDEARIYIALAKGPSTHLQLSRDTEVNRTKVYRLVDSLEKRGLIARRTDDTGTFLVASEITNMEPKLAEQEEKVRRQRIALQELASDLASLRKRAAEAFFVQTYEDVTGYRQMCWHELQTKGNLLVFGNGTVEEEASDIIWSDRHRQYQIESGYRTLEITNYDYGEHGTERFTAEKLLEAGLYVHRRLSPQILTFDGQTVVYNDTVGIYHWKHEKKVGLEIVSPTYAEMMRQIFWHYWELAEDQPPFCPEDVAS